MEYKISLWLGERGIKLEESFAARLRGLAKTYNKENGLRLLDDVYKALGTRTKYALYINTHLLRDSLAIHTACEMRLLRTCISAAIGLLLYIQPA